MEKFPLSAASPLPISARQVINNMLEGVILTDARGLIQAVNPAFCAVTGYSPEEAVGRNPRFLQSGRHDRVFYETMWKSLRETGWWQGEIWNRRKNGETYVEALVITAVKDESGRTTHFMGVFTDITGKKIAEDMIRRMAFYDPLTLLPNRVMLLERLKSAMADAKRLREGIAVLFLDLDKFKYVNDTLGHDAGDEMLKQAAQRFVSTLADNVSIGRLGGDEFMVVLKTGKDADGLPAIAESLVDCVRPPFYINGQELYMTVSVGISLYPLDGDMAESLMKAADTAMYRAKRLGGNSFQVFSPSMRAEIDEIMLLGNQLRRDLERNEFLLFYQPQLKTETGEIVGVEALLRWLHPKLGLISPSRFIHWAEETGAIVQIGEWVLRKACQQAVEWQKRGFPPIKVGVNLSARQFRQTNLAKVVADILDETGLEPDYLDLELTESVLMESSGPASSIPQQLSAMGVGFSIDDFGTGYSSLSYLKRFPVKTLKMDQSFVHDLGENPYEVSLASAVVNLGHGLNLEVTAEGVETRQQLELLRSLKCDKIQGFLVSEPVPPSQLELLLQRPVESLWTDFA